MTDPTDAPLFCYKHPKVETTLRCYQCGRPICVRCARRTPVGYICSECQRGRQQRFDQSQPMDSVVALVLSVILGGTASILPMLGSWWFLVFLSPLAGTLIAEVVWRAVGRRHSPRLWWLVSLGIVIGTLPIMGSSLLQLLTVLQGNIWGFQGILTWGLHVVLAISTAVARLRLT